jgi:protein TonB
MMIIAFALAAGQAGLSSEPPLKALPPGLLGKYMVPDDYPADAFKKGEQGAVDFVVDVSPEGRVIGCTITQTSGSVSLDGKTCELARQMRIKPSRGPSGPAVSGRYLSRMRWVLPRP